MPSPSSRAASPASEAAGLPGFIADVLFESAIARRAIAFVRIDAAMNIAHAGGHLADYGLAGLRVGAPAGEQIDFIDGFLPLAESPFVVPSMEFPTGRVADVQLYDDAASVWILLVDVTDERDAARRMQQKAYDMTLLQEKEAQLNRELVAANAALRTAQAEIERSRAALAEAYGRLEAELAVAAAYVRSILPPPIAAPFRTDWRFVPCTSLGGDSFGYHWIDADHFAVYLLDVCGHGVGPSLLSVGALNALRGQALPGADMRNTVQVLAALNELYAMERHNDLYFTIWYGVYRPAERRLEFASAGHPPAVLVQAARPGRRSTALLRTEGPGIGMIPEFDWQRDAIDVPAGSALYVLSDGTFEVHRPDGSMMTLEDLVDYLADPARGAAADLDDLYGRLQRERGSAQLEDDFSIIRLEF